jgi:hypothetical protein
MNIQGIVQHVVPVIARLRPPQPTAMRTHQRLGRRCFPTTPIPPKTAASGKPPALSFLSYRPGSTAAGSRRGSADTNDATGATVASRPRSGPGFESSSAQGDDCRSATPGALGKSAAGGGTGVSSLPARPVAFKHAGSALFAPPALVRSPLSGTAPLTVGAPDVTPGSGPMSAPFPAVSPAFDRLAVPPAASRFARFSPR